MVVGVCGGSSANDKWGYGGELPPMRRALRLLNLQGRLRHSRFSCRKARSLCQRLAGVGGQSPPNAEGFASAESAGALAPLLI